MVALLLAASLALALLVSGWGGHRLLQGAAPALVRVPRLAVVLLGAGALLWVAAVLSLGPLLAWVGTGPQLLPAGASLVCERCLQSANPFASSPAAWAPPAVLLLAATALLFLLLLMLGAARVVRDRRRSAGFAASLRARATAATIHGTSVLMVDDAQPMAFALPARLGGIVLSTATLSQLGDDELGSVLAHEREHLNQRHHAIGQIVAAVTAHLKWVPLIDALARAIDEYMEIAADDAARKHSGTPALAAALLKLGAPAGLALDGGATMPAVLNAAGPGRIVHLVSPRTGRIPMWPLLAILGFLVAFGLAAAGVYIPYLAVLITGCL